jgi:hypothetical protein
MLPLFHILSSAARTLASGSIASALSKGATNYFISSKIAEYSAEARDSVRRMYENYWKNLLISVAVNVLIILTALSSFFFFSVNHISILIISLLSLGLTVRVLIRSVKTFIRVIPHIDIILKLITDIFYSRSLPEAIKKAIRNKFQEIYYQETNGFVRTIHGAFATLGFIKSADAIEEDVVDEFYRLIKYYILETIASRIVVIAVFYGFFFIFLRQYIFSYTLKMSAFQILDLFNNPVGY